MGNSPDVPYYYQEVYNESNNNTSYNVSDADQYDESFWRDMLCQKREEYIVRMVIFSVFISFGIIGNIALLFIILNDRHLRNTPNVLISNLAFADLAYILASGPLRMEHEIHPCWLSSAALCALRNYAPVVCQCACVYSLVALSRERYSAIVKGIHSRNPHQMKVTICWALLTWIVGLLFAAPILSLSYVESYSMMCTSAVHGSREAKLYAFFKLTFLYMVPLCIVSIHYSMMAKTLIQSTRNFRENSTTSFARQRKARKRLAHMSIAISIFFGVFWLPGNIYMILYDFMSHEDLSEILQTIQRFRQSHYYLSLANPCFNPWLVFVLSTSHRRRLIRYLRCAGTQNRFTGFHSFRDTMTLRMNLGSSRRRNVSGESDRSEFERTGSVRDTECERNESDRNESKGNDFLRVKRARVNRKRNGSTRIGDNASEAQAGANSTTYV